MRNVNKMIIEKCTSEESCAWLLEFLQKIPNFNLNLTAQEKKLIQTPGNVLCIGRSGTGKVIFSLIINSLIDYISCAQTLRFGDPLQDPLDPLLQGCHFSQAAERLHSGGSRFHNGSALSHRDSEPRPHKRDQTLLLLVKGESGRGA